MNQQNRKKPDVYGTTRTGTRDDSPLRSARFSAWISELQRTMPHFNVHIANERAELTSVFEMLHNYYVRRGYIQAHPSGILYRPAFGHPASRTLVAIDEAQGELTGTLSIIGDEAADMPLRSVYADQLDALQQAGRRVAEVSSLVIHSSSRQRSALTLFQLTQFAVQYLLWRQYDDLIFLVHPRHQAYYSRWFEAETIGDCRPHPLVRASPATACRMDLRELHRLSLYPLYLGNTIPTRQLAQPPITVADHSYFCDRAGVTDFNTKRPHCRAA